MLFNLYLRHITLRAIRNGKSFLVSDTEELVHVLKGDTCMGY